MSLKTYPNGLRLSIIPKQDAKLISVDLHITSGTQSEKNYESGISEFTSRMLLMGTKNHPTRSDLFNYAKNNGLLLTSDNTSENILVSISTVKENLDKALDLINEIAFESMFDSHAGDIVRNQMLSTVAKLQENTSYTLERMANQALFYRTGLANPKFGTMTTISRMTSGDSKEFLERVLTPKNTIISVVGDVDSDFVYEKVMQTFYSNFIDGGDYKKLKYVAAIEDFAGGERCKNKKLNQSRILFAFPSLSFKNSRKYVLNIAAPIVENVIREETANLHYYHAAKVNCDLYANNGKFTIECIVDYENVNEYVERVINAFKSLKLNGLGESEFENERNEFIIKFLQENETVACISKNAAREVSISKQGYSIASELMKIELLKVVDANRVINEVLDFNKLFVAYLGSSVELNINNYIK